MSYITEWKTFFDEIYMFYKNKMTDYTADTPYTVRCDMDFCSKCQIESLEDCKHQKMLKREYHIPSSEVDDEGKEKEIKDFMESVLGTVYTNDNITLNYSFMYNSFFIKDFELKKDYLLVCVRDSCVYYFEKGEDDE